MISLNGKAPYSYPKHKIGAEQAKARLEAADADMARARELDNGPQDSLPEVGVVRVPNGLDGHYNRRFQGDGQHGALQGEFVSCIFDGDSVTVHENYASYTGRDQKIYRINRADLAESTVQNIISGW